jgi:malonyl-ACP decarboxylase
MASTATTTMESAAATAAGVPHAGESVIALHPGCASVLDTAKGAMPPGRCPGRETAFGTTAFGTTAFGTTAFGTTAFGTTAFGTTAFGTTA